MIGCYSFGVFLLYNNTYFNYFKIYTTFFIISKFGVLALVFQIIYIYTCVCACVVSVGDMKTNILL